MALLFFTYLQTIVTSPFISVLFLVSLKGGHWIMVEGKYLSHHTENCSAYRCYGVVHIREELGRLWRCTKDGYHKAGVQRLLPLCLLWLMEFSGCDWWHSAKNGVQTGRGEITYLSRNFSLGFKFLQLLIGSSVQSYFFLISDRFGVGEWLFLTTAVKCSVLFIVTAEYSDHCVLLQSINILKLNGAFHISQKLKTMVLYKL